jgi:hypothetical protein
MRKSLALVALALAAPALAGELPRSELSIGGVASGATEASVLHRLGSPSKRVDTGEGIELHYPGLVVTVGWLEQQRPGMQRRALALFGTGPRACTPHGLCPGMPAAKVTRLYGSVAPVKRDSGTFLEYQPKGVACWLQVAAPGAVVESVAVACQP